MKLLYVLFVCVVIVADASAVEKGMLVSAQEKSFKITKSLIPYFAKNEIDLDVIESKKKGSSVHPLNCESVTVDLPNGNQEKGIKCIVGLASGLTIIFDPKLNPIRIAHFVP